MTPFWFCSTAGLFGLLLVCLWTKTYRWLPLYFWANVSYCAIAISLIWAYYSPAINPLVYSRYFYVTQRVTQVMEIVMGMYLWRWQRPRCVAFIGAINVIYAAIKVTPYIDREVSEEVQRSLSFSLQQWANLAVIIASCIALAWCKFKQEYIDEDSLSKAAR